MKKIKRIKKNVGLTEYQQLMGALALDTTMRQNSITNLQRTFTILYYTGCRVNECQTFTLNSVKELISTGQTIIVLSKTNKEHTIRATNDFKKALKGLFDLTECPDNLIIRKGSNKNNKTGIDHITFIKQVNAFMKKVLGTGYTSHSGRQGFITSMANRGISTAIISKVVGHTNVSTTEGYITPSDADLMNALIR